MQNEIRTRKQNGKKQKTFKLDRTGNYFNVSGTNIPIKSQK